MEEQTKKSYEEYCFRFGKYRGRTMIDVFEQDEQLIFWLADQENSPRAQKVARALLNDLRGTNYDLSEAFERSPWRGLGEVAAMYEIEDDLGLLLIEDGYVRSTHGGYMLLEKGLSTPWILVYTREYLSKRSSERRWIVLNTNNPAFRVWIEQAKERAKNRSDAL